uniref:SEC-C metal-binding domain-containing protein n=1 Tax=Acetatifactor sp. TaxID=1872090 RepID=UPI004056654E
MSMRKVLYGPEGIMLSHIMKLYDKQSLLNYASDLQIRRVSGLKKDELAEKIANELLAPSVMKRRIATFSPEERALFERAIECPFVPTEDELDNAYALREKDYAFMNKKDELNVPVDVAEAYKKVNTPEFRQYAKKMSWLAQCLYFGENFYGVFDKDVLLEMYNTRKGYHISYEELEHMCNEFPEDLTECRLEEGQKFIVVRCLAYNGRYEDLLDMQASKDFYIPTAEEVLDYNRNLYLSKEPAYQKLREFFQKEIGLSYRDADDEAAEVWEKIQYNVDFQDMFQYLIDLYGEELTDRRLDRLINLLQNANNHTRLQIHRGHTPNEIMQSDIRKGYFNQPPVMVPGSTTAANMLKNVSVELATMGVKIDLDSNVTVVEDGKRQKKIYPNDPCPCGSGKKFKKCCGKG